MRTVLLLVASLATAAQAQTVGLGTEADRAAPAVLRSLDCTHGVPMPQPFPDAPEAGIPAVPLSGLAPAPMPNLCAAPRLALTAPDGRLPMSLDGVPPAYRSRRALDRYGSSLQLRDPDPVQFRDRLLPYPNLHAPLGQLPLSEFQAPRDLLKLPLVAPLGEHE